ncbi:RHS repeat-associated core domain-containing protein, partial [Pseudomonas fragariae (ex Marin et al. 2024)]
YGHRAQGGPFSGFNGERADPVTGHYLLGNGYRAFNPVLMRFNRPDSLSPFGRGGLNAYAYCQGDPVNRSDPGG